MPLQTRTVTDPATALANWSKYAAGAAPKWTANVLTPRRDPFQAAIAAIPFWQSQVSSPAAATAMAKGLNSVNIAEFQTTVQGQGQANYRNGVTTKTAKMGAFLQAFIPKLGNIVSNLDRTNPRGDYSQNVSRLQTYLDAVHATKGQN